MLFPNPIDMESGILLLVKLICNWQQQNLRCIKYDPYATFLVYFHCFIDGQFRGVVNEKKIRKFSSIKLCMFCFIIIIMHVCVSIIRKWPSISCDISLPNPIAV
jgi:hypothetical protein